MKFLFGTPQEEIDAIVAKQNAYLAKLEEEKTLFDKEIPPELEAKIQALSPAKSAGKDSPIKQDVEMFIPVKEEG